MTQNSPGFLKRAVTRGSKCCCNSSSFRYIDRVFYFFLLLVLYELFFGFFPSKVEPKAILEWGLCKKKKKIMPFDQTTPRVLGCILDDTCLLKAVCQFE